jgi:hypothetical protein
MLQKRNPHQALPISTNRVIAVTEGFRVPHPTIGKDEEEYGKSNAINMDQR